MGSIHVSFFNELEFCLATESLCVFHASALSGAFFNYIMRLCILYHIAEGRRMEIQRVGMKVNVDKLGRIVIPKKYRDFYHLNREDEVFVIDTPEGVLVTNPNYMTVKVEEKES